MALDCSSLKIRCGTESHSTSDNQGHVRPRPACQVLHQGPMCEKQTVSDPRGFITVGHWRVITRVNVWAVRFSGTLPTTRGRNTQGEPSSGPKPTLSIWWVVC